MYNRREVGEWWMTFGVTVTVKKREAERQGDWFCVSRSIIYDWIHLICITPFLEAEWVQVKIFLRKPFFWEEAKMVIFLLGFAIREQFSCENVLRLHCFCLLTLFFALSFDNFSQHIMICLYLLLSFSLTLSIHLWFSLIISFAVSDILFTIEHSNHVKHNFALRENSWMTTN